MKTFSQYLLEQFSNSQKFWYELDSYNIGVTDLEVTKRGVPIAHEENISGYLIFTSSDGHKKKYIFKSDHDTYWENVLDIAEEIMGIVFSNVVGKSVISDPKHGDKYDEYFQNEQEFITESIEPFKKVRTSGERFNPQKHDVNDLDSYGKSLMVQEKTIIDEYGISKVIKKYPHTIPFIGDEVQVEVPIDVQKKVFEIDPMLVKFIDNLDYSIQKQIVDTKPELAKYINNIHPDFEDDKIGASAGLF